MSDASNIVYDGSVVEITHNVQDSGIGIGILTTLWFGWMASKYLIDDYIVQTLLTF